MIIHQSSSDTDLLHSRLHIRLQLIGKCINITYCAYKIDRVMCIIRRNVYHIKQKKNWENKCEIQNGNL